jgi:hypothetical protein
VDHRVKNRVAIFCDVQSLWYNAKYWGEARVDYAKLLVRLADGRDIEMACAYLARRDGLDGFERALQHMGYVTRNIPSNVDQAIADSMKTWADSREVGTVALASAGGPRYVDTVRLLRAAGKRVELWTFPEPGPTTHILVGHVDEHRLLDRDVLKEVARAG